MRYTIVKLDFFPASCRTAVEHGASAGRGIIKAAVDFGVITTPQEGQAFITSFIAHALGEVNKAKMGEPRTSLEKQEDFKRFLSETIINLQRIEVTLTETTINPSEAG